jgi:glycosyltransferase involved in cell wall biosynthesis
LTVIASPATRVALVCTGIGRVQRGFERMFADLFALLRDDVDITLFKGGGPVSAREKLPLFLHRNSRALRLLPVHRLFGRTALHTECALYALGLLPYLRHGAFDVVHTIEAPLTKLLYHARARLGLRFTLIFTEATAMPPSDYPPADHIHQVSQFGLDRALQAGYRPETMTLLPCGLHPERFAPRASRAALRAAHGIAADTFVVLSVAALNRTHKRTDYLVDELARVPGDILLLLDGSLDHGDPALADYARARLGPRVRVSHVPSGEVRDLYALADVMAHVAMFEGFGIAIVEAASTGLPVITHDAPHFQWLLPNPACWIDARQTGALAQRLSALMADRALLAGLRCDVTTRQRFAWDQLKPGYMRLYREAAGFRQRSAA